MTLPSISKIFAVDQLDVTVTRTDPKILIIHALGRVTSTGWTDGQLARHIHITPPSDGVQQFDFIALPPSPDLQVNPVLTKISAHYEEIEIDVENYWSNGKPLVAVRVLAAENNKTVYIAKPPQVATRSGGPAMHHERAVTVEPYDDSSIPSFSGDIKILFRDSDVTTMRIFGLDLHDYEDVKANADVILQRLKTDMPCDGLWPDTDIAKFEAWKDGGMPG